MKITDNIYMLESTKGSYVYLIQDKENVLIDTGFSFRGKALLRELQALGVAPESIKRILITHHDLDHIGNACMLQSLTGAQLWAHKDDIAYIKGEKQRYGFKKHLSRIFRVKKPKEIKAFTGDTVAGVTVIETPGHTPGHVCFLFGGALFAGDLVENKKGTVIPYPAPWTLDSAALEDSIKRVEEYPFEWVCPAHGLPFKRTGKQICG